MALIDRAIIGAKARLQEAQFRLETSMGNPETVRKKENQVAICKITLEALEEKRDRERCSR